MPTSATGRCDDARRVRRPLAARAPRQRGFTLVELLVALIIAAVIVSMVAVSGGPNPERAFRQEADRLAQLLSLAREEAQVRGAPIRFVSDGNRFQFVIFKDGEWRPIEDDAYLRTREWEGPTQIAMERSDGLRVLEFGREVIEPPFRVLLNRDRINLEIVANGLGQFEVLEPR